MHVTLLGTGSAMPSPERVQSGVLVEEGNRRLLVDCGSGVVHRLAQSGVDHREVDTVLLTHHHLDHVADLPTLAKARWLDDRPEFTVVGPPATGEVLDHLLAVDEMRDRLDLTVREHGGDESLDVAAFSIRTTKTTHSKPCFAYRFGDALALGGDTAPDPDVFALADGVHTLVHECSFPDGVETEGHTTPTELGRGLADVAVERVFLTHAFPAAERRAEEIRETVASYVDAEVRVASDGERFEITA